MTVLQLVTAALVTVGALRWLGPERPDAHKRGALIRTRRRSWDQWRAFWGHQPPLTLCGRPISSRDECKHFKLIGTTGTGKSTAIAELIGGALERGDRALITDPDGTYRARFFDRYRGDVLLNPFDPSSVRWDPFAEIHELYDVEQLASGLIPDSDDPSGREWRGYARTFFVAIARHCHQRNCREVSQLWRLLAIAPNRELRALVAGTPAQPFLEPDNARMLGSIRSVAASAAAALATIQVQRGPAFSVREWVRSGRGVLFIPYRAGQIAALHSIIAAWVRLAIFEAMSCPEADQRLWFVMDELDALGAIDGLKDALARLRKFGGRCVLGLQSIAQVSSCYGAGNAQTIVENCGNTLILRCSGSEQGGTAQFAARLIGDREVARHQITRGHDREGPFSARGGRRSSNFSVQHLTEAAVMPSELEQLPDLHGFLKTASSRAWQRVKLVR